MAVDPILDLTNPDMCTILSNIGLVVHTIVPELGKFTDDNKVGMFPHPVDICVEQNGMLYMLDYNPLKKESRLVSLQRHNPVRTHILKSRLPNAHPLTTCDGIVFVCTTGILVYGQLSTTPSVIHTTQKLLPA